MKELTTYLKFDGNCREAMTFYSKCFGVELTLTTFGEASPKNPPEAKDRIIHARLTKGAPILMASDTMPGTAFQKGDGFSLSIECDNLEEIQRLFTDLSEGGQVTMALQDMFWGAHFGMLTDKFGIKWMLNLTNPKPA